MKGLAPVKLSFEFFPPKSSDGYDILQQTAKTLSSFHPEFFSVTYGAGGSTREGTLDAVNMVRKVTKLCVAPHLACAMSKKAELMDVLQNYKTMQIERIVTLRGDLPADVIGVGDFCYASDFVKLVRECLGDAVEIVVAAYPEIHPQAKDAFDDVQNLKRKFLAGANSAITQYFFNPDSFFYFRDECSKQGIDMPLIPGIMPINQFERLARFSSLCGAEIPMWIYKRLEYYADDLDATRKFGLDVVAGLCEQLIRGGVSGLHFYTLNRSEATVAILSRLQEVGVITTPKISNLKQVSTAL